MTRDTQQTTEMNVTVVAFVANKSSADLDQFTEPPLLDRQTTCDLLCRIIRCVALALGIPGNVLSAIVWLRRHIASDNSSAVYLAALAVNDLVYLSFRCLLPLVRERWLECPAVFFIIEFGYALEPLLVFSFSVERLFAIVRPIRVCCSRFVSKTKINQSTRSFSKWPEYCTRHYC